MPIRGNLTQQSVLAIFAQRPQNFTRAGGAAFSQASQTQADKYHVTRKTIRDIWNRKSWARVTANFVPASADDLRTSPSSSHSSACPIDADNCIHVLPANLPQPLPERDTGSSHSASSAQRPTDLVCFHPADFHLEDTNMRDPFHGEWLARMTHIDMTSMVAARDMDTCDSVEVLSTSFSFSVPVSSSSSSTPSSGSLFACSSP